MGALASLAGRSNDRYRMMLIPTGKIRIGFLLLLGVATGRLSGQSEINLQKNDAAFNRLWLSMDSIENNQNAELSILYLGGSHVQAGWIGHYMRGALMKWSPATEWTKGLMLPYRLAQTNTPTHFRTEMEGHWDGLTCAQSRWLIEAFNDMDIVGSGIQVQTTSAEASIQHVSYLPDSTKFHSTAFDVWTNADRDEVYWNGHEEVLQMRELETGNGWRIQLAEPTDTFRLSFRTAPDRIGSINYAGAYAHGLKTMPKLVFNEWGHNGLHIEDLERCTAFEHCLLRMQPDLIIMGIGLNDAIDQQGFNLREFSTTYSQAIKEIKATLPDAAILFLSNTNVHFARQSTIQNSEEISAFLSTFARKSGNGFFDLGVATGGNESTETWMANGWTKADGIHFSQSGYHQIAQIIFDAVLSSYHGASLKPRSD
jgi:lysophospholipase L1-like esterase